MKIVVFQGGLGNQLFEYTYYLYLKMKFPNTRIYGYYYKKWLQAHNGLEIDRWFDVQLPRATLFTNIVASTICRCNSVARKLHLPSILSNANWSRDDDAMIQEGFWQNRLFFEKVGGPEYNDFQIDDYNKHLLEKIGKTESVSIHIRRGDYMTPENRIVFGNICTESYYKKAIDEIKKHVQHPFFFIFSNDVEYAKSLFLSGDDCIVVDENSGEKSFFDLYLMSHCKYMILANSSFCCWAAYLNPQVKMVCSPSRWVNVPPYPEVNLDTWKIIDVD